MYFSKIALLSLAASVLASPTKLQNKKRALEVQDYADFQVSDGVAGNALAEVAEKFPIEEFQSDLEGVSEEDLEILKAARETAEAAETDEGGFNEAIEAAGEDTEEGEALQVGKIKNKVLKLQLEVLALQIEQAQSGEDNSEKIDEETTKLNANVANDEEKAGATSQSVDFQGTSEPDRK